jgi:tetratricopeptide (TPR) repeat protein
MLRNRKMTEVTLLLAALLASLFSVGTARAQSNDRRGLANSDRQSDLAVFSPTAHAPSPPSDLLKGNVGETASSVSVRELTIPDKAREAYNKGIRQADAGDWTGSVPNFQRAIKSFPAYYEAYSGLGVAEVYLQNWNEAEASFRKCIELSGGTFAAAHFGLGLILSHRQQFPEAEAMIREGIQLDPADARGHFSLAWVLHTMGDSRRRNRARAKQYFTNRRSRTRTSSSRRFISTRAISRRRSKIWKATLRLILMVP